MTAAAKILVIEDEPPIRKFVRISLEAHGYVVNEAETGAKGILSAASDPADCLILDLGLPDQDGLEVLGQFREWSNTPVIVLSARGRESDKIAALDAGADDYLTKPFSVGELLARIRVALRHAASTGKAAEPVFIVGDVRVDLVRRQVHLGDVELRLTPNEYRLLAVLVKNSGKVVTHRQLLKEVWGPDAVHENQYLRVYMGQLRRKLERDPAQPEYLTTEPGVGYRLRDE